MSYDLSSEVYKLAKDTRESHDGVSHFIVVRKALTSAFQAGRELGYAEGLGDAESGRSLTTEIEPERSGGAA